MDSSKKEATKAEAEASFKIEPSDEDIDPGLAFAPIVFDPEAQVAALAVEEVAPVHDDEDEADQKPDLKPAINAIHVVAIHQAVKVEPKVEPESDDEGEEPPPPGADPEDPFGDRKSTRLNSSHSQQSRMPSSA